MIIKIPDTFPLKPLPQTSSSDDNDEFWEHETDRQEREHLKKDEELERELDLD